MTSRGSYREGLLMKWFMYVLLAVLLVGIGVTLARKRSTAG